MQLLESFLLVVFLLGPPLASAYYVDFHIEDDLIGVNYTSDGEQLLTLTTKVTMGDGQLCSLDVRNSSSFLSQTKAAIVNGSIVFIGVNFIGLNDSLRYFITMDITSEKNHKYLPYVADDLYHISYFGRLSRIPRAKNNYLKADRVMVDIEISETCHPYYRPTHGVHSKMDPLRNILMSTILFPLIIASRTHQLCTFDDMRFRDSPLALHSCCHLKVQKVGKENLDFVCHNPEWMRSYLSNAVTFLSFLFIVTFPLMVKCLPHRRRIDSSPVAVEIQRAKESRQTDEDDEVMDTDDLELLKNQKWVYLDVDPVHWLSSSIWMIINQTCLHSRQRYIIIGLRFFAVFLCWSLDGLLMTITYIYYNSIFHYSFLAYQESILRSIFKDDGNTLYGSNYQQIFLKTTVYVPLAASVLVMTLLSPIMMAKKRIAKILFWHQKCTVLGELFECTIANKYDTSFSPGNDRVSYPDLVHSNLKHNLQHIIDVDFWKAVWNQVVCRYCHFCRFNHRSRSSVFSVLTIPVMMPLAAVYICCHCLPMLSVFTNIVKNWRQILAPCQGRLGQAMLIFTAPMFVLGCLLFFFPILELVAVFINAFMFLLIDVVRQSGDMLPKVIFLVGVVMYIHQAFVDFNDKYRDFKLEVFSIAKKMNGEQRVMRKSGLPLLLIGEPFPYEQAIPYAAYDYVCGYVQPHRSNVARSIFQLLASLFCISVFFAIILEYQIFEDVTKTSETFLSVITVMLPRVIGVMKTEGYEELKGMRQARAIEALLLEITRERADTDNEETPQPECSSGQSQ
ncbi:hypothetical protein CAPTEDRAFT_201402 [Capitella teleta]|uniref:Uncharacterized protein n=1 Tax=Capitella teleta TaxID=283909 RepID=R7TQ69_CAPTE|nr:hypothetical protein CAPTEDRAFT_201402 [Capitella teleta]|eukprot:ELT93180.1 hypothetical protein CAPTEDRAFT_201402 [Capitella teleta]